MIYAELLQTSIKQLANNLECSQPIIIAIDNTIDNLLNELDAKPWLWRISVGRLIKKRHLSFWHNIKDDIATGVSLPVAFSAHGVFSSEAIEQLQTADRNGTLPEALSAISVRHTN